MGSITEKQREYIRVLSAADSNIPYATGLRTLLELSDAGYIAAGINVGGTDDRWIVTPDGRSHLKWLQLQEQRESESTED